LLEALASGLPVITATATGGAELVTSECGIVLPDSDDVDALAIALSSLVSDLPLMEQMGKAARSVAEQNSWTTMAQTYVDLFEELSKNAEHSSHTDLSSSAGSLTLPFGTAEAN
jgi:glycosyltransferase involved in cell wall biosynthesis